MNLSNRARKRDLSLRNTCAILLAAEDMVAEMARALRESPITEPSVVPDAFITGAAVEIGDSHVRIIGWTDFPSYPSGDSDERRLITRLVMPVTVARELLAHLRIGLTKGGH